MKEFSHPVGKSLKETRTNVGKKQSFFAVRVKLCGVPKLRIYNCGGAEAPDLQLWGAEPADQRPCGAKR